MTSPRPFTIILLCLSTLYNVAANGEPRSGYEYLTEATRDMQDDDFENPGSLSIDRGKELFNQQYKNNGKKCTDCHGEQGEKLNTKNIARYPVYDDSNKSITTLQQRIKSCQSTIANDTLASDHPDLIALETFVRNLAHGEKVAVETEGVAAEAVTAGKKLFDTRYGLIDISCYHCHSLYPGQMIRGQKISQGQGNGFPAYRLATGEITSLSQRIQQCLELMRAEPFDTGSDEMKLMELYIMSRSNGLAIETPAVRY